MVASLPDPEPSSGRGEDVTSTAVCKIMNKISNSVIKSV